MSEEIALAAGDLAHIDRLREELNHWHLQAQDMERERDDARAALRAIEQPIDTDAEEIRALVAGVRHYVMEKGLLIGECVAWNVLKLLVGVGQSKDDDDQLWHLYRLREGTAYASYYTRGTKR